MDILAALRQEEAGPHLFRVAYFQLTRLMR